MEHQTEFFAVAREAALEAGQILVDYQSSGFKIYKKGIVNLVTEVDLKAEQAILARIRRHFPQHQILAEEEGASAGEADYRWVIDPLDGTTNYSHGYPCFCVSIALERSGQVILGVVYNPVSREMFTAELGGGAFLNERPIGVSAAGKLIDSLLCTGFSYDREQVRANLELFNRAAMTAQATRRDGSAALDLCYIACGRFDGFWELTLHPWDVAAGKLIIEEAGGCVTDLRGEPCTHYQPGIIASNGVIHPALIEMLAIRP
jgi:myo-inositol-1(or 4)-monophosphatase